jgi:hypothetical protein
VVGRAGGMQRPEASCLMLGARATTVIFMSIHTVRLRMLPGAEHWAAMSSTPSGAERERSRGTMFDN